ncbi:MAG: NAD(P)H-binding protein [Mycobacterium pseudokansasii]|nr:NAD(P)H-binding protein [Mycobacterium pseudokansasii]
MKITVFGATGGVGKHLVAQALQRGHVVNAVVRDPARLPISSPALTVTTVPGLEEPVLLRPALRGSDAVLSAVGPRGRKDTAVAATGTRIIMRAMQATGVERLVAVSAAPVGPVPLAKACSLARWSCRSSPRCCATSTPTLPRWKPSWGAATSPGPSCGRPNSRTSR